ncbi:MAG: hypothetical protein KJ626_14190 [Verrucomicrobia bacterium]|nr:hypothetical protein [Verrucomicrobiota bacterium]
MGFLAHPFWFWLAIVMMVDAAIGLLGLDYWQKFAPSLNIRLLAMIECVLSICLVVLHFLSCARV